MPNLYKDYFEIDENYFPVIDQHSIESGAKWQDTFPHETVVGLFKRMEPDQRKSDQDRAQKDCPGQEWEGIAVWRDLQGYCLTVQEGDPVGDRLQEQPGDIGRYPHADRVQSEVIGRKRDGCTFGKDDADRGG